MSFDTNIPEMTWRCKKDPGNDRMASFVKKPNLNPETYYQIAVYSFALKNISTPIRNYYGVYKMSSEELKERYLLSINELRVFDYFYMPAEERELKLNFLGI